MKRFNWARMSYSGSLKWPVQLRYRRSCWDVGPAGLPNIGFHPALQDAGVGPDTGLLNFPQFFLLYRLLQKKGSRLIGVILDN